MIPISIFYIYCNFMHYKTGKSYRPVSVFCFLGFNFFLISKNFLDTIQIQYFTDHFTLKIVSLHVYTKIF